MATPVGTLLCVGMLGLATVILVAAAVASAFVSLPVEDWDSTRLRLPAGHAALARARHCATAV
jgi:hypothetical protein